MVFSWCNKQRWLQSCSAAAVDAVVRVADSFLAHYSFCCGRVFILLFILGRIKPERYIGSSTESMKG